jgi:hypothetical protein
MVSPVAGQGIEIGAVILYVPAVKTISEQFGTLEIVLCSLLWLMPLFRVMVGPPHEDGGGGGVGLPPDE